MGNKKPKNLPNFSPFAIEKKNLQQIQEIAFYNVFDAFEINEALKILQITRQKIETSIIRPAAKKIEPYKKKFTKFKDYFSQQTGKVKSKIILNDAFQKKYVKLEESLKNTIAIQTEKALSKIFERNIEEQIFQKSEKILNRSFERIEQLQNLQAEQRELLLEKLYPYDFALSGKIKSFINRTLNISLGLVVATNIPFTGMLVNAITTVKTTIYLANRVHLLSILYGRPVICKEALFAVSARIVSSISDFENNPDHKPLSPQSLANLYQHTNQSKLYQLLKAATIKDLYISIPFVGSLSLAKISIDEQSITKLTLQLFRNYSSYQELEKKITTAILKKEIEFWQCIYTHQRKNNLLQKILDELEEGQTKNNSLKKIWKGIWNLNPQEKQVYFKMQQQATEIAEQFYTQEKFKSIEKFTASYLSKKK